MAQGSVPCNRGPEQHVFVATYQESWSATTWDTLRIYSMHLATAGGSGAAARTALAPLERVKILLQVEAVSHLPSMQKYGSMQSALRNIPRKEGYVAFYRGNGANVLRLLPDTVLKFAFYDQFKVMFAPTDGRPLGVGGKLAAGSATGILKCITSYPLELVHTRLAADIAQKGQRRSYTGILHCINQTLRHEGVRGLYKGIVASTATVTPYLAIAFSAYDEIQQHIPNDKETHTAWWYGFVKLGSGAAAGILASTAVYPLDTVRRRMQVNGSLGHGPSCKGYWDCVRRMIRQEGFGAFYLGASVNALRIAPAAVVQFATYDLLKSGMLAVDPSAAAPL